MSQPGSRINDKCRGCGEQIVMVMSTRGKWIPCNYVPVAVDGNRVLVFANGTVGKAFKDYRFGFESHFATCSKASQFRRQKGHKVKPVKEEEEKPVIGCGCLGGPR